MGNFILKIIIFISVFLMFLTNAIAQESTTKKTKFYNFDDLLIEGKVKKPQVLWTDARQKVKFEKLLKLKKDLLNKVVDTKKDPSLR
jgi:hypothetical protein